MNVWQLGLLLPNILLCAEQMETDSEGTVTVSSRGARAECSCEERPANTSLVLAAQKMAEEVSNKTMLHKIRHRATHSAHAVWASVCLSLVLGALVLGLLQSRMWADQTFLSYPESQPVKYEEHNQAAEVKVKHLLKSQARKLKKYFVNKHNQKHRITDSDFKMETFLHSTDEIDARYQRILESSDDDSEDSGEDVVFKINSNTGEWESERTGVRRVSEDNRGGYRLLGNTASRSLSRMSESSNDTKESEPLISI